MFLENLCEVQSEDSTMLASWKRSLEFAYFNHYMITKINKKNPVNWLLVDLGLENVEEANLNQVLDNMLIGFNRLFKYKSTKQATLGYFRMLDIVKKGDSYNPRIHILLPTIKSYFQGRYYIKYANWVSLWSKALGVEDNLYVNVKVVNSKNDDQAILMKMGQGLSAFHDIVESKVPVEKNSLIESRRLIGYSRLLRDVMDQSPSDMSFYLDMDVLCIEDSIANSAFESMLEWHPGLRLDENNPFSNNSEHFKIC